MKTTRRWLDEIDPVRYGRFYAFRVSNKIHKYYYYYYSPWPSTDIRWINVISVGRSTYIIIIIIMIVIYYSKDEQYYNLVVTTYCYFVCCVTLIVIVVGFCVFRARVSRNGISSRGLPSNLWQSSALCARVESHLCALNITILYTIYAREPKL